MNEVKQLCERMLDVPAPPMRASGDMLGVARRSARRRAGVTAVASWVAVTGLVAGGVAVAGALAGSDSPPEAAAAPTPRVPSAVATRDHAGVVAMLLIQPTRAAGYGFTGGYVYGQKPPGERTVIDLQAEARADRYVGSTTLLVSKYGRQGVVSAKTVKDNERAPTGDLCRAEIARRVSTVLGEAEGMRCEVVTVDGVRIRVTSGPVPRSGEVRIAVRFLEGGYLAVISRQSSLGSERGDDVSPDDRYPPLAESPFSAERVAALAANPAILP